MKNITISILILCGFLSTLAVSCSNKTKAPQNSFAATEVTSVKGEVNTLLSNPRQLTFVGSKSGEGYFSPDGRKMIFQSERDEKNPFYQIYILDLETGATNRVSPGYGKTTCAWFHPSMKKVLFSSSHLDPQWKKKSEEEFESRKKPVKGRYSWSFDDTYDIFSSDLQGRQLVRLTKEKGYDAEASYSPDGQWIAFASNRSAYTDKMSDEDKKYYQQDPSYMMDIYIMKSDGTQVKRLTNARGYDGGPFFSADGKKITWRRFAANGMTAEVYTMNVDGSEQKPLTHLKSMSWAPYFHPSGDYVVFASSVYGYSNFELFIVDAQGKKEPVRVTFDQEFDGLPVFTPDGKKLSWTHRNTKGDSQIFMADWDDAQARRLLGIEASQSNTQLTPDFSEADVKAWVQYLASEEFAGRKTGSAQEKVYTQKLADTLKSWGYVGLGPQGSFFQEFEFTSGIHLGTKNSLEVVGSFQRKYVLSQEFEPLSFSEVGTFREAPVVFVGYGIKAPATEKEAAYDSYKDLDVKGKWVLAFADIPQNVSTEKRHHLNAYSRLQHKVTVAKNQGAQGIIFTNGPLVEGPDKFGALKFDGASTGGTLAVFRLSTATANELLKHAGKNASELQAQLDKGEILAGFEIPSTYLKAQVDLVFEKSKGLNVVAKLPVKGANKSVMIGAHGDHLGHGEAGNSLAKNGEQGKVHPGADDNASGVAGVMELAHTYAQRHHNHPGQLKKNLIVAIWSGEEIGILGSSHWVKQYAKDNRRPASQEVVAYLNMDMIGRLKDKLYVQGIASGKRWPQIAERVAATTGTSLVLQEDPYLPTDSMALYLGDIPSISFFTGAHADYHSPRDTANSLNYPGVVSVIRVVKGFADPLLLGTEDVRYVKVASSAQNKMEGRSFRVYVGTIPDYAQDGAKGVRISGVSKDSPAEKAGLKDKDVIQEFDGRKIENLYDYVYVLQSLKPNKETTVKVLRQGQVLELKVTPKLKE